MPLSDAPARPRTASAAPDDAAPDADDAAVRVRGLVKRYDGRAVVDGLDLTAAQGAVTAVLGPNGAGKTTTIECCEGLRSPDGGTVRVLGLDPVADARRLRPRVGVMLQDGGLPTGVRALELLRHVAAMYAAPARWTSSPSASACTGSRAPRCGACRAGSGSGWRSPRRS
nr:hypothetical protein GCM10025730_10680 [Promicromonospora thailandica]